MHYLITKYDTDDYGLWITEDITDESQGSSIRGSLEDIKKEVNELLSEESK